MFGGTEERAQNRPVHIWKLDLWQYRHYRLHWKEYVFLNLFLLNDPEIIELSHKKSNWVLTHIRAKVSSR